MVFLICPEYEGFTQSVCYMNTFHNPLARTFEKAMHDDLGQSLGVVSTYSLKCCIRILFFLQLYQPFENPYKYDF